MNATESNFKQELIIPSQGLLNPEIPEGKVVQRCMMVADQKFLSGSNIPVNEIVQQLLQRTIVSPEDFDIQNLTIYDTTYLLFKLRILSYGKDYKFSVRCPECGKKIDVSIDLSELMVDELEEDYQDKLVVTLYHRKDKVYTKLLTNKDQIEIEKECKRRKKKNIDDSRYVLRLVHSIEKIELSDEKKEITHPIDIERYINQLTDLDASIISGARDSIQYGIAPTVEYICPECNNYIEVPIQTSENFFRPQFNK